jgi:hypothetical protein
MTPVKAIGLCVLFAALLGLYANMIGAAQAKNTIGQRGSAVGHTASRGSPQSDHQWSADPERGWVLKDESDGANDRRVTTKRNHSGKEQTNDKGKKF